VREWLGGLGCRRGCFVVMVLAVVFFLGASCGASFLHGLSAGKAADAQVNSGLTQSAAPLAPQGLAVGSSAGPSAPGVGVTAPPVPCVSGWLQAQCGSDGWPSPVAVATATPEALAP
jgi:hypothetical protein